MSGSDIRATLPNGATDRDFSYRMELVALQRCLMSLTTASPVRFVTQPSRIDVEQVVFQLPLDDTRLFVEDRRETFCAPGMGLVSLNSRKQIAGLSNAGRNLSLSIPLAMVSDYLKGAGFHCDHTVSPDNPFAALLRDYCLSIHQQAERLAGERTDAVVRHIVELAALTIGASSEGAHQARRNTLPEARLELAKNFVRRSLADTRLDDEAIGRHLGVSAPVVRRIFHAAGLSVSGYVRDCRLDRARAMLSEPLYGAVRILEISHLCGFSDISTFNRSYMRKFGMTPRETRQGIAIEAE